MTGLAQPVVSRSEVNLSRKQMMTHLDQAHIWGKRGERRPFVPCGVATQRDHGRSCPDPQIFVVLGLVVSRNYPDLDALPACLTALEARCPYSIIWVCASTDLEAKRLLHDPILLELNPYWKTDRLDQRRQWRDTELLHLCERVYVFQKTGAKTTWNDLANPLHPGVRLTEAGKAPKKKRAKARIVA